MERDFGPLQHFEQFGLVGVESFEQTVERNEAGLTHAIEPRHQGGFALFGWCQPIGLIRDQPEDRHQMDEADLGRRPPNRPQAGEINGTLRRSQRRFDFRPKPLISICFAARSDTVDLTSVRLRQGLATAISILKAVSVSGLADDVSPQEGTRWPVRNVVKVLSQVIWP